MYSALEEPTNITIGRAAFAVAGMSTAVAGASAIILATGGAALLVGGESTWLRRTAKPRYVDYQGTTATNLMTTPGHFFTPPVSCYGR